MTESIVGSPVVDVIFEERRILVVLEDGRALAAPIGWAGPTVLAMDETGRAGWVRTNDGRGVNWPDAGQTSAEGALDVWSLEQDTLFEHALAEINAGDTLATVREFWQLVGPIAESDEVSTIDDVYAAIDADLSGHLRRLDETFWEVATELIQLVPLAFGPAPSATGVHHADPF